MKPMRNKQVAWENISMKPTRRIHVSLKPGQDYDDDKGGRRTIGDGGAGNEEITVLATASDLEVIEGIIRDDLPGKKTEEGSTSKVTTVGTNLPATMEEPKGDTKIEEERTLDRSKFKKVEMPVFYGIDLDS
ncbi:hypothetical protein E6C27_scaffold213G00530 [Cucumis melo var. makuwa]|uniref:Uncharacterized protein n=1 Tax=Cucumis melo var. makuwa TaxID=1194695 RepID=A0A5A7T0E6_CUCMM|nr:hypothetical protein E6C27_scaffold213G00530 [Cucumis melo var. makuwa]